MMIVRGCLGLALALAVVSPAAAQQTRREALEQQRAARAAELAPYKPGRIESALTYIERERIIERYFGGEGLYPIVGSLQRGGGLAFGAGYRSSVRQGRLVFDARGGWSTKGYRVMGGEISLPQLWGDRLTLTAQARYRYFPQEDYFGLGNASLKANRTTFLLEENEFAGVAVLRPRPWLSWSAKIAHLNPRVSGGTDSRYPTVGTVFTDATAPGLARQPRFLETGSLLELDSRDQPGNPRSGTYVSLLTVRYGDLDDFGYDFTRLGVEVQHYVPIFDKKRVIAVRAAVNRYDTAAESSVPFYYTQPLGGKDSIRGFTDFRFRDRNSILFNAEYRWEAFAGLDMALFYDLGDVARSWDDLSARNLKQSWGLGLRFNTYRAVFLRTEVAFNSGEGTRLYVAFGRPLKLQPYLR